jgi:hypothetical protein
MKFVDRATSPIPMSPWRQRCWDRKVRGFGRVNGIVQSLEPGLYTIMAISSSLGEEAS